MNLPHSLFDAVLAANPLQEYAARNRKPENPLLLA